MTREEMKVIISVYQLWLTEKEELVADLCGADCAEPKGKSSLLRKSVVRERQYPHLPITSRSRSRDLASYPVKP